MSYYTQLHPAIGNNFQRMENMQLETICGEQVRCLRARSTIPDALENYIKWHTELQRLYPAQTHVESFLLTHQGWVGLYFQKAAFPLNKQFR